METTDQFMELGWKRLIPISLVWVMAVAVIRLLRVDGDLNLNYLLAALGVLLALVVMLFVANAVSPDAPQPVEQPPRTGGFPTPPMPVAGAVRGAAAPLVFGQSASTVTGTAREEK